MFNLKEGTKFNVTYFAKKYGKFITRAGVWTEKSKEWVSKKNETLFTYFDYHLGVEEQLFYKMMALFNLEKRELEKLLEKWFDKHYPDNMVITAYPIVE